MMLPQDGMVGGVPAPIKERIDSTIIALAQIYVACTSIGASELGRMWRRITIGVRVPDADAASTWGCARTDGTRLRTSRETRGTSAMVMATMALPTLARVSAISATASRIGGIDISPSMNRIKML